MNVAASAAVRETVAGMRREAPVRPIRFAGSSIWWVFALIAAALLGLSVLVALASFSRTVAGSGAIVPSQGVVNVLAVKAGVVEEVFVREGERVVRGAPLLRISSDTQIATGALQELLGAAAASQASAARTAARAQSEAAVQQIRDARERETGLRASMALLDEQRELQSQQVELAQRTITRAAPVVEKGYISTLQFQQWQAALVQAQLGLRNIDERRNAILTQLRQLHVELQRLDANLDAARAQEVAQAGLGQEKQAGIEANREVLVRADRDGMIAAISVRPGTTVTPGSELAVVTPGGGPLVAEVWLPSEAAGLVRIGDPARLRFTGAARDELGTVDGRVVSRSGAPTTSPGTKGTQGEPQYLTRVALTARPRTRGGRAWEIVPGMKLTAKIVVERRSLLTAVFGRIANQLRPA